MIRQLAGCDGGAAEAQDGGIQPPASAAALLPLTHLATYTSRSVEPLAHRPYRPVTLSVHSQALDASNRIPVLRLEHHGCFHSAMTTDASHCPPSATDSHPPPESTFNTGTGRVLRGAEAR